MQLQPLRPGQRVRVYANPYDRTGLLGEAVLVKFSQPLPAAGLDREGRAKLDQRPAFPKLRAGTWWVRFLDGQSATPVLRLVLPELV